MSNRWREVDHTILFNFGFTADFTDFNDLVLQLAASGAQSVLLVLESPEIQLLWKATEDLQLLHEEIVWVAVESWASINFEESDLKRNGAIGLSFYESNEPTSLRFLDMWKSLDPEIYPDADGNRDRLEIYSGYIVDSVVALALAYQQAIEQQTNLGNDDFFRQYVYDVLCTEISFEGVSGHKEFTLYGNQVDNKFTIRSYYYYPASTSSSSSSSSMITKYSNEEEMVSNWMNIGFLNQTLIHLDMKDMMWPDGSSGKNTKYSSQLLPYCAPGMEPIKGSSGVYTCTDCAVGFYKSTYGSTSCQKCPNGGDCNDVGVIIPCILPGYWRMNPPSEEELDDFVKYKIYRCDNEESCLGGCNLNISCSTDRIQSSPTCGVCAKEYYMSNGYCTKCTHTASYAPILIYFFELFGVCLILYFILNSKIKYDPQSLLIEELNSKLSIHEPPVFSSSIPMATATASAATYLTEEEKEGKNSKDSTSPLHSLDDKKNSLSLEEESSPPPITRDDTDDDRESSLRQESFVIYQLRFFTQSISSTQVYRFTSFAIFNTFLFFQSLLPRTSVTFKLIISFWQVMTSGFFSLQISWPNNMKHFFISIIALNPFDAILATSSCTQHHMLTSYLILIIIFCLPFIFLCCLLISILVIYYFKILKYSNLLETQYQPQEYGQRLSQRWRQACYKNLWSMSTTIMVWFSLIIFAIGSAT